MDFIPRTTHGRVLVTSQTPKSAEIFVDSSTIVRLSQLSPRAFDPDAAQTLYAKIGGIPLALTQASASITAQSGFDLATYCQQLEERGATLLEEERPDSRRLHRNNHSAAKVIQLSILKIPDERGWVKYLLGVMCMFSCQQIPRYLINRMSSDQKQLSRDLGQFSEYSLISWMTKEQPGDTITIHGVVQIATELLFRSLKRDQLFKDRSIQYVYEAFPFVNTGRLNCAAELWAHAELVLQYETACDSVKKCPVWLLDKLAHYEDCCHKWHYAMSRYFKVFVKKRQLYGPHSDETLRARSQYVMSILRAGDVEKAGRIQSEVLLACIEQPGTSYRTIKCVLRNSMQLNTKIGRFEEALEHWEQLRAMPEADPVVSTSELFHIEVNSWRLLTDAGRMGEAEAAAEPLLDEYKGSYNALTFLVLTSYAVTLHQRREIEKATDVCVRILGVCSDEMIEENFLNYIV